MGNEVCNNLILYLMKTVKHFISILIAVILCVNLYAWDGTGSDDDPYLISSAEDLAQLATNVNKGTTYLNNYFLVTDNIDLQEWIETNNPANGWIPIGNFYYTDGVNISGTPFRGYFDGGNYIISGMRISQSPEYQKAVGLFGLLLNGAGIKNIRLSGSSIENLNTSSGGYIGSIVGCVQSRVRDVKDSIVISNCHNTDIEIKGGTNSYIGGIIGYCQSHTMGYVYTTKYDYSLSKVIISDCSNNGKVYSNSSPYDFGSHRYYYMGGIVGYAEGYVLDYGKSYVNIVSCNNSADITAQNTGNVGGIVGYIKSYGVGTAHYGTVNILHCSNSGNVNSNSLSAGGINGTCYAHGDDYFGYSETNLQYCKNEGTISAGGDTGGILGTIATPFGDAGRINIYNCENNGAVTGNKSALESGVYAYAHNTGGICGSVYSIANFHFCINNGTVSGQADEKVYVGGIVGYFENLTASNVNNGRSATIDATQNNGLVIGNGTDLSCTGGIVGSGEGINPISNSFNTAAIQGGESAIESHTGGIAGYLVNPKVNQSYNTGTVTGSGTDKSYTGGVVGFIEGMGSVTIARLHNTGTVKAGSATDTYTGGLTGYINVPSNMSSTRSIADCYSTCEVDGNNTTNIGGLIGYGVAVNQTVTLKNCYAATVITHAAGSEIGSFMGYVSLLSGGSFSMSQNFYDKDLNPYPGISNRTYAQVAEKTTQEMRQLSTFSTAGWDIAADDDTKTWAIKDTYSYPYFPTQSAPATEVFADGSQLSFSLDNANPVDSVKIFNHTTGTDDTFTFEDEIRAGANVKTIDYSCAPGDLLGIQVFESGKASSAIVWFTVDAPTSINHAKTSTFSTSVNEGQIIVEGEIAGKRISVYTTNGAMIYNTNADANKLIIPLCGKSVYIIHIGNESVKVVN
jgi:hypothetical protein